MDRKVKTTSFSFNSTKIVTYTWWKYQIRFTSAWSIHRVSTNMKNFELPHIWVRKTKIDIIRIYLICEKCVETLSIHIWRSRQEVITRTRAKQCSDIVKDCKTIIVIHRGMIYRRKCHKISFPYRRPFNLEYLGITSVFISKKFMWIPDKENQDNQGIM